MCGGYDEEKIYDHFSYVREALSHTSFDLRKFITCWEKEWRAKENQIMQVHKDELNVTCNDAKSSAEQPNWTEEHKALARCLLEYPIWSVDISAVHNQSSCSHISSHDEEFKLSVLLEASMIHLGFHHQSSSTCTRILQVPSTLQQAPSGIDIKEMEKTGNRPNQW